MRTAITPVVLLKPTVSETSLAERREIIRLSETGWSAPAIAEHLGCSVRTITRWRSAYRAHGEDGLAYHSRRPQTPAPHTTPAPVIERIAAIRRAHPGWGARLIQRQLRLDGVRPLPSERTVQNWLGRLGCPPVRPPAHKPLGFPQPPAADRDDTIWEVDHKEKGGAPS
jgi:transposase